MSVESTITKVIYVGNGVATEWPVPFKYNKPEHLHLLVTDAAGAHELVTSNFQVQVTEAGDTSILYPVSGQPLAAGKRLTIYRATPQTQIVDLIYGGAFAPEVLEEDGLDREVMMIQELQEGLDRAVKVDIDSDQSPEELRDDLFAARDTAVDSATCAAANANAAANSAQSAAGSAAIATEQREAACICAGEAKAARDAAIAQAEAANALMEAELAKVNAIVAANKTDQQAAVTAARQWAEKEADTPVDYDEEGNPRYSARHWAENAQKIAIEPPTAERRGAIRVGPGLELTTGENGETDVLGVSPALGSVLLANSEEWITESGTFTAPVTGGYEVLLFGGGGSAGVNLTYMQVGGGGAGPIKSALVRLEAGDEVPVTVGAGGISPAAGSNANSGGATSFGEVTTAGAPGLQGRRSPQGMPTGVSWYRVGGAGTGGGYPSQPGSNDGLTQAQRNAQSDAYGHFGGGGAASLNSGKTLYAIGAGAQGSARVRWHDPAKAAGALPAPALFAARRMARVAAGPATVNLYDPETGQGSVWREEDAEAKLAEGLISEAAWTEICAARAAEARAAWLADPETEPERFELLRQARDEKLAATDYLAAPDYPLTDDARAAVTAYRQALRDLPAQEGAPWDGGGEATPWPEMPAVEKAQE